MLSSERLIPAKSSPDTEGISMSYLTVSWVKEFVKVRYAS